MMGPARRASGGPPAPPQGGWVGKQKLCVAQAAITNNMAGISTVCSAMGNAAHQCAFRLRKQRRSVREFSILRHLTRRPK
jgi:hypothetical protein